MKLTHVTQLISKDQINQYGSNANVIIKKYDDFFIFYLQKDVLVPLIKVDSEDQNCEKLFESDPIINIMYTGTDFGTGDKILENDSASGPEKLYTFE